MREISIPFTMTATTDSVEYRVRAVGNRRADGIWEGHIEFHAPTGERLVTGMETTQPDADSLQHWASALEQVYIDSALRRARTRRVARSTASVGRAERRL